MPLDLIVSYLSQLDLKDIRVLTPSKVIFLCGGLMAADPNNPDEPPLSLRDVFFRMNNVIPSEATVMRAEDVPALEIMKSSYEDIMQFETDFAQICELIILFCESSGSFCELGSFASNDEIASRTMVVLDGKHYNDATSYIRLGPVARLQSLDESSVFVFENKTIGLIGNNYSNVDRKVFSEHIKPHLLRRLSIVRNHTTFDPSYAGHVVKALVGITQEFAALERDEAGLILQHMGAELTESQLRRYVFCAQSVGWLKVRRYGARTFLIAEDNVASATNLRMHKIKDGFSSNVQNRRSAILQRWSEIDRDRFAVVRMHRGSM